MIQAEKLRQEIKLENRKFLVQALAALGTALGGGAALMALVLHAMGKI